MGSCPLSLANHFSCICPHVLSACPVLAPWNHEGRVHTARSGLLAFSKIVLNGEQVNPYIQHTPMRQSCQRARTSFPTLLVLGLSLAFSGSLVREIRAAPLPITFIVGNA